MEHNGTPWNTETVCFGFKIVAPNDLMLTKVQWPLYAQLFLSQIEMPQTQDGVIWRHMVSAVLKFFDQYCIYAKSILPQAIGTQTQS